MNFTFASEVGTTGVSVNNELYYLIAELER